MDRSTILTAAFSDTHREDLQTTYQDRFMIEAESIIRQRLEFYALEATLDDTARVAPSSAVYNLPARDIALVRHVFRSDGLPLDQVDETNINTYSSLSQVLAYVVRPTTIKVAGNPGAGDTLSVHYFGMPTALLSAGDSNTLLNDYPNVYKEAIQVSIWKRARDFDAATAMFQSVNAAIDEINRKMKKLLGGARSANPYNTEWKSSY